MRIRASTRLETRARAAALLLAGLCPALAAQEPEPPPAAEESAGEKPKPKGIPDVDPPAQTAKEAVQQVQKLLAKNEQTQALVKLAELEARFPEEPDIFNLRGSILLSPGMRDAAAAEAAFRAAEELRPGELAPAFNLAEVAFVTHDWDTAAKRLAAINEKFPGLPAHIRHLILFKLLVCHAKSNQLDRAERLLAEHFTFMDDTPAYYFSKAAIAFQQDKKLEGGEWISKGKVIFGEADTRPYLDSLEEARWVPKIGLPPLPPPAK